MDGTLLPIQLETLESFPYRASSPSLVVRRLLHTSSRVVRTILVWAVSLSFSACSPEPTGGQVGTEPAPGPDEVAAPALGIAWVIFEADTIVAEVAKTPDERSEGLMYRESLASGTGMLFVFPEAEIRSFWMKNTFIAMDIAYLDPDGRIVDIQQMEPESSKLHSSAAAAMFALEVPQGWFAEEEIEVGDLAEIVFGH